jgi:glutamine synthetase
MSNARQEAIKAIAVNKHKLDNVDFKTIHLKDIFGSNVFSEAEMQARLPKTAFKSLMKTIHEGAPFEPAIADSVAAAMRDWALEHGATHYTHLFQPMTGITAEKHDSFLTP